MIDFGVARDLERTRTAARWWALSATSRLEQLAVRWASPADLYALGATALHLLVRRAWEFMDGPS